MISKYKWFLLAMWLALPVSALNYSRAWNRLPARMAVHFDANWHPNGYTSREGALQLGLGIMVVLLVLFTVAGLVVGAVKPAAAWPMLAVFYVVLGFVFYGNYSIVKFNLNAQPANSGVVVPLQPERSFQLSALARRSHGLSASARSN
jgi:hypothetical protein